MTAEEMKKVSVISLHELYFGAYLAREKKAEYYERELNKINILLEFFTVLDLETRGEEYAKIKHTLRKLGKPVDEFDIIRNTFKTSLAIHQ